MRPEILIGWRYTRSKRRGAGRNSFISFIALVSMLGIGLGVAALITVLSVMNGFQTELRTRILGVASHIQITGIQGELADWRGVAQAASRHPDVRATAPFVTAQGMLSYDNEVRGVMVRGIEPALEDGVADFAKHMRFGALSSLKPGEFGIVLGAELAQALRVRPGDKVTLIAPQGLITPAAILPRLKQFRVVGLFEVGMFEYDSGLALIHLQDAQALYRLEDRVTGVRLKLSELMDAPRIARELSPLVRVEAYVTDWSQGHANLFRAVQIEKNVMFVILLMIVAVAAFNIVSTLVMAVNDKRSEIAILRTLGASPGTVMGIFMVQGALIGVLGLVLGVAGGVALATNLDVVIPALERLLGVSLWSKEVYYITELPSELHWQDVAVVSGVSFLLTLLATLYPSARAARVVPAEALRYE